MDQDKPVGVIGDRGVTSVQFVLASGLALIVFIIFANLVVVQYGRGALRSAVEQGARAGTTQGVDACESVASLALSGLLGGRMGDGIVIDCRVEGQDMVAMGGGSFQSWTPVTPDFAVNIESRAAIEP